MASLNVNKAWNWLGLREGNTCADVRKKYKYAALRVHPDKGGNAEQFKELGRLYALMAKACEAGPLRPRPRPRPATKPAAARKVPVVRFPTKFRGGGWPGSLFAKPRAFGTVVKNNAGKANAGKANAKKANDGGVTLLFGSRSRGPGRRQTRPRPSGRYGLYGRWADLD